eukprot:tig00001049_g6661.t1
MEHPAGTRPAFKLPLERISRGDVDSSKSRQRRKSPRQAKSKSPRRRVDSASGDMQSFSANNVSSSNGDHSSYGRSSEPGEEDYGDDQLDEHDEHEIGTAMLAEPSAAASGPMAEASAAASQGGSTARGARFPILPGIDSGNSTPRFFPDSEYAAPGSSSARNSQFHAATVSAGSSAAFLRQNSAAPHNTRPIRPPPPSLLESPREWLGGLFRSTSFVCSCVLRGSTQPRVVPKKYETPTCPACLIFETYYVNKKTRGKCLYCKEPLGTSGKYCRECAEELEACHFCGIQNNFKSHDQLLRFLEDIAAREMERFRAAAGGAAAGLKSGSSSLGGLGWAETNFAALLRDEWKIFLIIWRDLLTRDGKPRKCTS